MTHPATTPASSEIALASPLRVEVTFEYTFEELREGLTQSPEIQRQQEKRKKVGPLFGWVLFISLAVFLFLLLNKNALTGQTRLISYIDTRVDLVVAAGPSVWAALIVATVALLISLAIALAGAPEQKDRDAARQMPIVAAFAAIFIIGVGAAVLWSQADRGRWLVTPKLAMAVSLGIWVVVLILCVSLTLWLTRTNLRRMWNSKPYLHRRRTIVLDDQGEHSADGITEMLYRWPYFRRAWETANCLVLQDENDLRHILPKRVMDQPTLDQARAVIANHIADTKFLTTPGGFPVAMPAPTPAATPVPSAPGSTAQPPA